MSTSPIGTPPRTPSPDPLAQSQQFETPKTEMQKGANGAGEGGVSVKARAAAITAAKLNKGEQREEVDSPARASAKEGKQTTAVRELIQLRQERDDAVEKAKSNEIELQRARSKITTAENEAATLNEERKQVGTLLGLPRVSSQVEKAQEYRVTAGLTESKQSFKARLEELAEARQTLEQVEGKAEEIDGETILAKIDALVESHGKVQHLEAALESARNGADAEIERLAAQAQELETAKNELSTQVEELTTQLEKKAAELAELGTTFEGEKKALQGRIEDAQIGEEQAEEARAQLETAKNELEAEKERLSSELEAKTTALEEATQQATRLQEQIDAAGTQKDEAVAQIQAELQAAQAEAATANAQLTSVRTALDIDDTADIAKKIGELQTSAAEAAGKATEAEAKLAELTSLLGISDEEAAKIKENHGTVAGLIEKLTTEVEGLSQSAAELKATKGQLDEASEKAQAAETTLQSVRKALNVEENDEIVEAIEDLNEALEKARSEAEGSQNLISDIAQKLGLGEDVSQLMPTLDTLTDKGAQFDAIHKAVGEVANVVEAVQGLADHASKASQQAAAAQGTLQQVRTALELGEQDDISAKVKQFAEDFQGSSERALKAETTLEAVRGTLGIGKEEDIEAKLAELTSAAQTSSAQAQAAEATLGTIRTTLELGEGENLSDAVAQLSADAKAAQEAAQQSALELQELNGLVGLPIEDVRQVKGKYDTLSGMIQKLLEKIEEVQAAEKTAKANEAQAKEALNKAAPALAEALEAYNKGTPQEVADIAADELANRIEKMLFMVKQLDQAQNLIGSDAYAQVAGDLQKLVADLKDYHPEVEEDETVTLKDAVQGALEEIGELHGLLAEVKNKAGLPAVAGSNDIAPRVEMLKQEAEKLEQIRVAVPGKVDILERVERLNRIADKGSLKPYDWTITAASVTLVASLMIGTFAALCLANFFPPECFLTPFGCSIAVVGAAILVAGSATAIAMRKDTLDERLYRHSFV